MANPEKAESSALQESWATLPAAARAARFRALDRNQAQEVFRQLAAHDQAALLLELPPEERCDWASALAPDDAADCVQALPAWAREDFLNCLDAPARAEVVALLGYAEDEAGGLMNPRYARMRPDMLVDDAILDLRQQAIQRAGTFFYVYVLDGEERLVGVVSVRELLAASGGRRVEDVMRTDVVRVAEDADQEEVARLLAKHDLAAIPVVTAAGRIAGVVSGDDILDVVRDEAAEDIQRIGGVQPSTDPYLRTPLPLGIWRRGGWLAALFLGEMLTASAMSRYQDDIARSVALALFVPLIISSGGNSGSQATTLVIRAMALGELGLGQWRRVLTREVVAGSALGLLLGSIGLARVLTWEALFGTYGQQAVQLAAVVGLSVLGVVLWGSVSGAMLPFALRAAGLDPASASAPLVATVVDVTGIVIYFTVARAVLGAVAG
jgi:magnesium transporter